MATICKRLKDPLAYLEQVRQHLGRLPSIDPNTRTLLICGYPNVGKSSFLRSISRADVDVQPYAFTTKSLFVGHFDYKMLRFQAIDTPGVLDHPLEEMNTIEMQSITAIAHLRSAVCYFMDLSEQCGYPVSQQIALFNSIKPLFANKLTFIVINKIDLAKPSDLDQDTQATLSALLSQANFELLELSCTTTENVMTARNAICDRLLAARNAQKLSTASHDATGEPTGRLADLLRRIHVAQPLGGITRESFVPPQLSDSSRTKYNFEDPNRRRLERDLEAEEGGAGVYNMDLQKNYLGIPIDQLHDKMPEFHNGRNVAEFIDPDIARKIAALEAEEEKLMTDGFYEEVQESEDETPADREIARKAELIREKRVLIRNEAKQRKSLKNRAVIPRSRARPKTLDAMESHLESLGHDPSATAERMRSQSHPPVGSLSRGRSISLLGHGVDAMDIDSRTTSQDARAALIARSKSRARSQSTTNRLRDGVGQNEETRDKAERLAKLSQKKMNRMARQGEADRHTTASLPKHLLSGKRGIGKTRSR